MAKFKLAAALALLSTSVLALQKAPDTYDYIVVGSGPGGGPLAANLAKANFSVLLLEAGTDQGNSLSQRVPSFNRQADNDPLQRWDFFVKYHSDPAVNRKYLHLTWRTADGKFYVGIDPPAGATQLGVWYPRAGTLGGCSTHNALAAALPSDRDWGIIAELTGDECWVASNMRKYFDRLEHNDYLPPGTPGHGFNGYLNTHITDPNQLKNQSKLTLVLQIAAKLMGQEPSTLPSLITGDLNNNSPNRDQQVGISGFPTHQSPLGVRVSARDPVIAVLNATNADGSKKYPLTLRLESFITKVLFDTSGQKPKATGVEYLSGQSMFAADPGYFSNNTGTLLQAYARKEVIISGGIFNTPLVLKHSGIGPRAELDKFNITLILDAPGVGANLQDNYEMGISAAASVNFTNLGPRCTFGAPGDPCLSLWENGTGPYTFGQLDSLMFKTSHAVDDERDLFMWGGTGAFKGFWPGDTVNVVPADPPSTFAFNIAKMHSRSRLGTVSLTSSNPRDVPDINFRFFEDEDGDADIAAMIEGIEFGRSVYRALSNSSLGPFKESMPCQGAIGGCDTKAFVREQAWSHHASSSCPIGADGDKMAVLDSKFRVRGVEGLRA